MRIQSWHGGRIYGFQHERNEPFQREHNEGKCPMGKRAKFGKRHYIETARIILASGLTGRKLDQLIQAHGEVYALDNPLFSWERWFAACKDGMIQARQGTKARPMGVSDGDRKLAHTRIFGKARGE